MIAHRGASRALRENTLRAFREAYARGADAVELDVRRTADGVLVVHHDAVVPGVGPIVTLDRDDLEEAAPWIPDLVAAVYGCAGMWINVEIKNNPADPDWDESQAIARTVARVLRESGPIDRFLVSSFNPETIRVAAETVPELATGWLADTAVDPVDAARLAADAGHRSVHPHVDTLAGDRAGETIEEARRRGLWVIVWTVDDPDEMLRLADAGVDGLITNVPAAARSAFENRDRHRG